MRFYAEPPLKIGDCLDFKHNPASFSRSTGFPAPASVGVRTGYGAPEERGKWLFGITKQAGLSWESHSLLAKCRIMKLLGFGAFCPLNPTYKMNTDYHVITIN
jgi:hypothetical protein